MLHGGQSPDSLQLVKIAFLVFVILPIFFEEFAKILGSFSDISKEFFFKKIFVSLATNSLLSKLKIPSLKL